MKTVLLITVVIFSAAFGCKSKKNSVIESQSIDEDLLEAVMSKEGEVVKDSNAVMDLSAINDVELFKNYTQDCGNVARVPMSCGYKEYVKNKNSNRAIMVTVRTKWTNRRFEDRTTTKKYNVSQGGQKYVGCTKGCSSYGETIYYRTIIGAYYVN